ncbi:pantoate-beta-alanine ligase [Acrodontium crateriforme]|uniref:Pantoate--beta-alanine ligase n=1 Tax=Acrodontium crateriforme TaxID=150365 RepID=A0AAQ3MC99_9PEZI|nr:pantoate-beta-alanine ligase [Acrodontium crateriforme]
MPPVTATSSAHIMAFTARATRSTSFTKKQTWINLSLNRPSIVWKRPFHIFRDVPSLRSHRKELLRNERTVGLVPTMGALHKGHLSLVRQAAAENTDIIISIYVNPTQFGLNEDLDSYPQTWDSDLAQLKALDEELKAAGQGRINAIFAPTTKVMYPTLPPDSSIPGTGSFVTITPLASLLEGKSRPVFFRGVATVCMKLFNAVQPENVYFGQKDVQQTVVIKRMVKDFHLDMAVRIGPTEREVDGLAMSSRNVYLGERRRNMGIVLSKALRAAEAAYQSGSRKREDILSQALNVTSDVTAKQSELSPAERALFEVDYISLADPETLEEIDIVDETKGAVLSGAIKMLPLEALKDGERLGLGEDKVPVRLIDNIILEPSES